MDANPTSRQVRMGIDTSTLIVGQRNETTTAIKCAANYSYIFLVVESCHHCEEWGMGGHHAAVFPSRWRKPLHRVSSYWGTHFARGHPPESINYLITINRWWIEFIWWGEWEGVVYFNTIPVFHYLSVQKMVERVGGRCFSI
jgi:hypothetical protein